MPYVRGDRKLELAQGSSPKNGDELLHYFMTLILTGKLLKSETFEYICDDFWKMSPGTPNDINEIGGAALNCALEFKRRGFHNNYREGLKALGTGYIDWYGRVAGLLFNIEAETNGDIFPSA